MIDLDKNKEIYYLGTFWSPDAPDRKFSGILTFSQENQISLKITGDIVTSDDFLSSSSDEIKLFHGFMEEIGNVTLINCISNGECSKFRQTESYFIKYFAVSYAILGIHCLKDDTLFTGISFHFLGLNNFCMPYPNEYFIADSTPQIDCTTDDNIVIKLQQGRKEAFDLSLAMFAYGNKYESKLLEELRQKTKNMILSKPFFFFHIDGNAKTAGDYIHLQYNVEKLFSIFLFQEIHSLYSFLKIDNKEYQIIDSFGLKQKINEEKLPFMGHLPVSFHNIKDKFSNILKCWLEILQLDLVNTFITDKVYNKAKAGLQQYSILVALIGAWQNKKDGDYGSRYENFFVENLQQEEDILNNGLLDKLKQILGKDKTLNEIAIDIGKIRNTILHIDNIPPTDTKIRNYGHIINDETKISNLCEVLFIVVIKAIYHKLGIELEEYQTRNLLRQCKIWSSIPI